MDNPYSSSYANPYTVAAQPVDVRAAFIRKTYAHLAGAVAILVVLEAALLSIPGIENTVFGILSRVSWLVVMAVFMAVSWIANKWAMSDTSKGMQYFGLSIYIVAWSLLLLPLLLFAQFKTNDNSLIMKAGGVTLLLFLGLTVVAFTTKKDFSFLGGILKITGIVALGLIAISVLFPSAVSLGLWFSAAMVIFCAGTILYNTSNIIHHYQTSQYVAASLGLFSSIALLFWYILQIFMSRD